jgi:hypothetical protein
MKTSDPLFTARLEPALRSLAKNSTYSLAYLTNRYDLTPGDLAAWLAEFNGGKKELAVATIEAVKVRVIPSTATVRRPPSPAEAAVERSEAAGSPAARLIGPTSDVGKWLEAQKVKVIGRVNAFQVEVTPAIATRWLALNQGNRTPSRSKIKRFALAMRMGRWTLNGETVKFSISGRLIDGQSRLMAVQAAAVPVTLEIRAGLPDEAQKSMDIGELRKGTHTLEMMGENHPIVLAPALKLVWLYERGMFGGNRYGRSHVMENYDVGPMIEKHAGLKASVGWVVSEGHGLSKVMTTPLAAFFHYLFGGIDKELRDHFFDGLSEGIGLTKKSPVYHLRERLLEDRAKRIQGSRKFEHRAMVIKAWNACRVGEAMSGLRHAPGDSFPPVHGCTLPILEPKAA